MLVPLLGEEMRAIWEVWGHLPFGSFPGGVSGGGTGQVAPAHPSQDLGTADIPQGPRGEEQEPACSPPCSCKAEQNPLWMLFRAIQLSHKEITVFFFFFPGNVFSSLAPQPASPSLSSFLLAHKAASLARAEFWRDITTSNVFFLLPGSYQPPAEEHTGQSTALAAALTGRRSELQ